MGLVPPGALGLRKGRIVSLSAAAILALAMAVRADMAGGSSPAPREPVSTAPASPDRIAQTSEADRPDALTPLSSLAVTLGGTFPQPSAAAAETDEHGAVAVVGMPAGPGSLSLFLAAIGGLGAWQFGRSAKNLHLGHVPEWYHAGGPAQIGHVSPIDPDFSALTVCLFEQPDDAPPIRRALGLVRYLPCQTQFLPAATAPRAPPLLS